MQDIVHYIHRDKFTSGYINFMKTVMTGYNHYFITLSEGFVMHPVDDNQIVYISTTKDVVTSKEIRNLLEKCQKFIVSGCFMSNRWAFLPKRILNKTYFHFWGGDFYWLRDSVFEGGRLHPRLLKNKLFKRHLYKNCKALLFLIDGEYEDFAEMTGIKKEHFVAPMPSDSAKRILYSDYIQDKKDDTIRVAVGHSATKDCQHIEVLELLKKYKDENIEIICPLSYGDDEYKEYVMKYGQEIFGNKFKPITEYMDQISYVKLLAECNVGINNCNRQQGMGNVAILLGTGATVYIRSDTNMWNNYKSMGFSVRDVMSINKMTFSEFVKMDNDERDRNVETQRNRLTTKTERTKRQWETVFEDGGK